MPDEPLPLEVTGLSASYGGVPAITDVSLTVRRGAIVTIVGANGAGKSTVIKCICGLVRPTAGRVRLYGEDVTGLSPDKLVRRGLSVVPEGRRLFTEMSFRENLELGAYTRSDPAAVQRDMARVLALFPDLRERLGTPAGRFSGGQQQMIAVARALMSGPRLLLLDEPTIGLGPAIVDRVADLVVEISRNGVDILIVEQNAEIALAIAERAYILEGGRVVAEDDAAVMAGREDVRRAYLGI